MIDPIKRFCGDSSTSWACISNGKHDQATVKSYLATHCSIFGQHLVNLCQHQVDNAELYSWCNSSGKLIPLAEVPRICVFCFGEFPELSINHPDGTFVCASCPQGE